MCFTGEMLCLINGATANFEGCGDVTYNTVSVLYKFCKLWNISNSFQNSVLKLKKKSLLKFILGYAGSSLLHRLFSSCRKWGLFFCCNAQALTHMGLSSYGSWALEHRLNSCGTWAYLFRSIFLDQELNPCLLPWQADFLPLSHQGNPVLKFWG